MGSAYVVLRLYPPYSTILGQQEARIPLDGQVRAQDFFGRLCDDHPGLRELFFPSGAATDFPGYTLVLRDGVPLAGSDVVRAGDVLEVLTALTGG